MNAGVEVVTRRSFRMEKPFQLVLERFFNFVSTVRIRIQLCRIRAGACHSPLLSYHAVPANDALMS
jgi:hypothetical protein